MPELIKIFHFGIKKSLTLFFSLLASSIIIGQSYSKNDSLQILKWMKLSDEESSRGSLDSALIHSKMALALSKEKRMIWGEGWAQLKVASILFEQEKPEQVAGMISESLKIGAQLQDSFMMATASYQQGELLMKEDKLEEAQNLFNRSLLLKFEKQQSDHTAMVYNDIGYLFGLKDEYEKQAAWYLKAIKIYERTGNLYGLATTTSSLAAVYANLGNSSKALQYTRDAIAMREQIGDIPGLASSFGNLSRIYWNISLDSAVKYQHVAMRYAEKSGLKSQMIRSYDNLSVLMDKQRNKPEALLYIKKSIAISREMNDKAGIAGKSRWAALLCGDMNDTIAMEAYYRESFELSVQLKNKTLLRDFYGTKASYYSKINDHKNAFDNLKKYYAYRDSLISDETRVNIAELQTKYETEKKDNEIIRLNTDQQIKQLEIEKQKAIISGNRLETKQKENEIVLLSQQQQLRDGRIKEQGKELEKQLLIAKNSFQELQLAESDKAMKDKQLQNQKQLRNFMIGSMVLLLILAVVLFNRFQLKKRLDQQNALLTVRNNIARDLHDEIGSALTSIKILSQVSHNNIRVDQDKAGSMLAMITEQSSQMQQGMSDIVWAIAPDNDKLENMMIRMREYVSHTLEPKNIKTVFSFDEKLLTNSLSMEQRRDLFLVFKEAINNAAKYSSAKEVEVKLSGDNRLIHLSVTDDGAGFDLNNIRSSNGLKNMRARTEALKGKFRIQSLPGKGVKVEIEIPVS